MGCFLQKLYRLFQTQHSFSVTSFTLGFRLFFFNLLQINSWPDGALRTVARGKIRHYRQLYINRPEPRAFRPVAVDPAGRIYEDFSRLLFLYAHHEASALANEIPVESEQFRFLRAACLPCFMRSRRVTPLLPPSLVFSPR